MKRRVKIYLAVVLFLAIAIFVYNVILEGDPRIIFFPLFSQFSYWAVWGCIPLVLIPLILVRTLFPPKAKYRSLFVITFYILFLSFSFSQTVGINGINSWLFFYNGYPRLFIYVPFTLFTVLLVVLLITLTKNKSEKVIKMIFWIVDILYIPIFFIMFFASFFASPA